MGRPIATICVTPFVNILSCYLIMDPQGTSKSYVCKAHAEDLYNQSIRRAKKIYKENLQNVI
jgi:hypothetical protein